MYSSSVIFHLYRQKKKKKKKRKRVHKIGYNLDLYISRRLVGLHVIRYLMTCSENRVYVAWIGK